MREPLLGSLRAQSHVEKVVTAAGVVILINLRGAVLLDAARWI